MKKKGLLFGIMPIIAVWFVLALMMARAHADTSVSGFISSDKTWTVSESPYAVTGSVIVREGVTLTIEAGVTVKFDEGKALQIQGALVARGSSASPITFTKYGKNNWAYIVFEDTSTDADYDYSGNYTTGSIMEYCTVEYAGGTSVSNNGAVRMDNAYPHIAYCTIQNNASNGVCAYNLKQSFAVSNCEISGNSGSGIYCYNSGGSLEITGCTVKNNKSSSYAGGIYASSGSSLTISDCTVTGNTGSSYGGIYASSGSSLTISDCTVTGNSGSYGGGICASSSSSLTISDCTVTGNSGYYGGGIYASSSSSYISNCTVTGNTASGDGGGIYATDYLTISDCTITGNTANSGGGGVYGYGYMLSKCIISKNEASSGGGICGYNLDIDYCTITGNKTGNDTSGTIFIKSSSYSEVINNTNIYGNTADYELWNDRKYGTSDVDASNNYWGTTDETIIQNGIYDFIDDGNKGVVEYYPYTSAFVSGAPDPDEVPSSPTATTSDATSITSSTATLNGTVNANGSDATVWFEYGNTSGSYINKSSTQTVTGTGDTSVSANITGLTSRKTYYFRVTATSAGGTTYGSEKTFTTSAPPALPTVNTGAATSVADTSATLSGAVNANGSDASVWFEYGTTRGSYSNSTTTQTVTGSTNTNVSASITGLTSSAVYYYRIVAENSGGKSEGSEKTFTTTAAAPSTGYISGSVTDASTGSGISGATVSTNSGGYAATTDSGGNYQLSNVAEGSYTVTATTTGYESASQSAIVAANATTTVNFSLTPSTTSPSTGYISGRVTDASTGSGISGATVSTDSGGYSATTDSIGSYQISNVAAGSYTLTASATGYESGSQSVTVTANAVTTANFELTAEATPVQTGTIAGTVLDSETGRGLSGATVSTDTGGYSTTTDARGSYRIQNVTTGSYTLTAEADGYEGQSDTVTVAANALSTVNFSLETSGSTGTAIVYGSVEDEYGDYFEGVEITISGNGYSDETETDEYGDYELYEVPAGSYTITFEAKGYETQSVTITVKAGDMYAVDTVRMEPEGEDLGLIYGYAYDIDGEPVEDVKITAKSVSTGTKEKVYTDGDGFFEFEDMEPGTYKVSTKKKGYKKAKETITLKSEQEKYVEFELRTSSKNRLIIMPEEMVIGH